MAFVILGALVFLLWKATVGGPAEGRVNVFAALSCIALLLGTVATIGCFNRIAGDPLPPHPLQNWQQIASPTCTNRGAQ